MTAWIGPLGALFEFKCPSAVESSTEDPHVYFRPLGGDVAVTRLGDGTRPRVWDVSVAAARPDHVAALQGLADGAWGPGPFVFIPPAGETMNLLGKRDALAMATPGSDYVNERPGTTIHTAEGISGAGYGATSATPRTMALGSAPVIPGVPVTGKVWVRAVAGATAAMYIRFHTGGGDAGIASPWVTTTSTTGEFLHVTKVAPAGTTYVTLVASGAIITRPQITWTDTPRTWAPSTSSQNVIVSPLSNSVRRATGRAGEEQITDHRFTVTELRA